LLGGYGRPVDIMLTPANFGYMADIKGYDYDLAKAKALIKEAGAEGAELPFMTSPVYDQRIAQAVQQMLGEAGLKVTIVMSDQATYLRRRQGTPQDAGSLSIGRWSCACQDADGVIQPLFHSASGWSKFKNAVYDEAVEKARATLDQTERLAWYRKALDILKDEVPGIGLYQDVAIYGARKGLRWKPGADESFFVFNMRWTELSCEPGLHRRIALASAALSRAGARCAGCARGRHQRSRSGVRHDLVRQTRLCR